LQPLIIAKITAYFKKESCTSDAFDKTKTKNIKVTLKSNTTKVRCCRPDKICKSPVYY
jgi:hypothetical protein